MAIDTSNFSFQGVGIVNSVTIYGCINPSACNYNPLATINDGSCLVDYGCTNPAADNYDPLATCDDGNCDCVGIEGCTNSNACNYDSTAECDDGSCVYPNGCTDPTAINYDPNATCDDGSCVDTDYGCTDPNACNYDPSANFDDGSCNLIYGCMNPLYIQYDPLADCHDPSMCIDIISYGCMDPTMFNYNSIYTIPCNSTDPDQGGTGPLDPLQDNDCCDPITSGCTDPAADNYDPNANTNDASCIYSGCTDPTAINYDPNATVDDGSCIISGCTDPTASNYNPSATLDDGSCQAVSQNTYFVFWSDTSGSMNTTIHRIARMASVPTVVSKSSGGGSGTTGLGLSTSHVDAKVNDLSGEAHVSYLCIEPGMRVSGNGIAPNTTVVTHNQGSPTMTLSSPHYSNSGDIITFTRTWTQKESDYYNTSNLRNLLQDYYATGDTEAQGNLNAATNGRDDYDSHIYWCHSPGEEPIQFLGNQGMGATIGPSGYFPNADKVVVMGFADEAEGGGGAGGGGGGGQYHANWGSRATMTNNSITTDVTITKTFINDLEIAAGNTDIYRGIFFRIDWSGSNNILGRIMGPGGLMDTGGRTVNGFLWPPDADAYNVATQTLYNESSGSPTRILYEDNIPQNTSISAWYDLIKTKLNAHGFSL